MAIASRTVGDVADDRSWAARGLCRDLDPEGFFVQGADQQRAKQLCTSCPVLTHCLADALDNRIEFGVWGGMTERERRRLLLQHPEVTSWADVLRGARRQGSRRPA